MSRAPCSATAPKTATAPVVAIASVRARHSGALSCGSASWTLTTTRDRRALSQASAPITPVSIVGHQQHEREPEGDQPDERDVGRRGRDHHGDHEARQTRRRHDDGRPRATARDRAVRIAVRHAREDDAAQRRQHPERRRQHAAAHRDHHARCRHDPLVTERERARQVTDVGAEPALGQQVPERQPDRARDNPENCRVEQQNTNNSPRRVAVQPQVDRQRPPAGDRHEHRAEGEQEARPAR